MNQRAGELSPETVRATLLMGQRLLGLDLGTKTIGIAICDVGLQFASPLQTIRRTKFTQDAQQLAAIVKKHQIGALVLGLPRNMDGSEGPRAQATRAFARSLQAIIALPMLFWDERLSTVSAERVMIEADMSRAKRAEAIDAAAAAVILQGLLDRLRYIATQEERGRQDREWSGS
jgi:putative holliday junction resolvase